MAQKDRRNPRARATGRTNTAAGPDLHEQGTVLLLDRHDASAEPYVVLSTARLPNAGEQYLGAPLTTTKSEGAIAVAPPAWEEGDMDRRSYALASDVSRFYEWHVDQPIGKLNRGITNAIATRVGEYIGIE